MRFSLRDRGEVHQIEVHGKLSKIPYGKQICFLHFCVLAFFLFWHIFSPSLSLSFPISLFIFRYILVFVLLFFSFSVLFGFGSEMQWCRIVLMDRGAHHIHISNIYIWNEMVFEMHNDQKNGWAKEDKKKHTHTKWNERSGLVGCLAIRVSLMVAGPRKEE